MSVELTATLEGVDELKAAIDRTTKAVGPRKTEPLLWEASGKTLARLKANVDAINKVTGRLRAAPARRHAKEAAWGEARSSIVYMRYHGNMAAPHSHLVEYGARGGEMPAQPFFRPAVDSSRGEVIRHVEQGIIKAVEGAWYK